MGLWVAVQILIALHHVCSANSFSSRHNQILPNRAHAFNNNPIMAAVHCDYRYDAIR